MLRWRRTCQLNLCLATLIAASALCGSSAIAMVEWMSIPLEHSIRRADRVLRVRVGRVERETYSWAPGVEAPCGSNFHLQVINIYKGETSPTITIAVFENPLSLAFQEVKVDDELLVLVSDEFDEGDPFAANAPDVLQGPPSPAKQACLQRLTHMRLMPGESAFLLFEASGPSEVKARRWMAYTRALTELPDELAGLSASLDDDCRESDCETNSLRRVPWCAVERKIREWTREQERAAPPGS